MSVPRLRRFFLFAVVAGLLGSSLWWFGRGLATRPVAVHRMVDGRTVEVEERGRGSDIVVLAEAKTVSDLAARLARRHGVIVAPALAIAGGRGTLAEALDGLGVPGDATIVSALPTIARLVEDSTPEASRAIRLVALDLDRAVDSRTAEALFAGKRFDVLLLSSPTGPAWRYLSGVRTPGRVSVSLIEACSHGLTRACGAGLATFIDALDEGRSGPGTGTVIEDPMRSIARAPAVIVVPNGQFLYSWKSDGEEAPRSFAVSPRASQSAVARTETTVLDVRRFVDATGYRTSVGCQHHSADELWRVVDGVSWSSPAFSQTDVHPVTCVTGEDAQAYAAWLSAETGHRYRLPTEMEFEFVNRAERTGAYGTDADPLTRLCAGSNGADRASGFHYAAPCTDGFEFTAPVGSFPPNDFGLFDTTGNLWELTEDCWQPGYRRAARNLLGLGARDGTAWGGACSGRHVVRGGSFLSSPANLRSFRREIEGYRSTRVGFRVVREVP